MAYLGSIDGVDLHEAFKVEEKKEHGQNDQMFEKIRPIRVLDIRMVESVSLEASNRTQL